MAGIDSSNESGFPHAQRTSAPQPCQQQEDMIFFEQKRKRDLLEVLNHGKSRSARRPYRKIKSRPSQRSVTDDTKTTPPPTSSNPSPTPVHEVAAMSLKLSLRPTNIDSNKTQPDPSFGAESTFSLNTLPPTTAEPEPPPSPRSQIRSFQAEKPRTLISNQTGPMERFLSQDNHPAGFEKDPGRMKEEGQRLRLLRTNALRLRAQLKIKRKELKEKEATKSSADEAFIRHVRESRSVQLFSNAQTSPDETADSYYLAMQAARDVYGPLEDEYTRIEDILDETEFEMAKIEIRLYGQETVPPPRHESATLSPLPQVADLLASVSASSSFLGLSTGHLDQYKPIHAEYLSRLGDLDLARERLQNMTQEHESLLVEQESRSRVGMELHSNLRAFLENLPAREAALRGEITEIELDVERLKSQCLEAGINLDELSDGSEPEKNFEDELSRPEFVQKQILGRSVLRGV
ncbi:uncharacterized protein K444DRAFT_658678 [Hyaloscypha bicolor E]|uniref:Uncharacterized protein n=1 Tax=Hyaloscypha bicolor E TaxID=1095630 RepID=A0A2J6TXH7_9HELO|nr:uncharacterized protein K444DRAFT_658678 [Hyaloscypha bicolor E]PMD67717.1 hypothetical protein K444DRAFT_658678 [Hyaloscypha bicolor E]